MPRSPRRCRRQAMSRTVRSAPRRAPMRRVRSTRSVAAVESAAPAVVVGGAVSAGGAPGFVVSNASADCASEPEPVNPTISGAASVTITARPPSRASSGSTPGCRLRRCSGSTVHGPSSHPPSSVHSPRSSPESPMMGSSPGVHSTRRAEASPEGRGAPARPCSRPATAPAPSSASHHRAMVDPSPLRSAGASQGTHSVCSPQNSSWSRGVASGSCRSVVMGTDHRSTRFVMKPQHRRHANDMRVISPWCVDPESDTEKRTTGAPHRARRSSGGEGGI
jgi:hypothetical protein